MSKWRTAILVLLGGLTATLAFALVTLLKPAQPQQVQLEFNGETISLAAFGDQGTGNLQQWRVADAVEELADTTRLDFVALLGDNFYRFGVNTPDDLQWRYKFENVYTGSLSATPFFATLGNHDYYGNEVAQINYDLFDKGSGRWQMPARDYIKQFGLSEDKPLLTVVFIDTGLILRDYAEIAQKLDTLLDAATPAHWRIVMSHSMLRTGTREYYNPTLTNQLIPVLKKHQVDAYLSGHDHNLQIIQRAGEPAFIIVGTGGKYGKEIDPGFEPGLKFSHTGLGFVHLQANKDRVIVTALDINNQSLYEYNLQQLH